MIWRIAEVIKVPKACQAAVPLTAARQILSTKTRCIVNSRTAAPPPFPFTINLKVNIDVDGHENLLQFFEPFFSDSLFNHIVTETNKYMDQHFRGITTHKFE